MRRGGPRLGIWMFLLGTTLALFALVAFSRYPSLFLRGREYQAVFTSVAGLNVGDQVRYGGLPVGTVTEMDLAPADPTRLVVKFRIRRKTPVRVDTRASITQVGFLGERYLNLRPGRPDAPPLPPGSTLASESTLNFQDAVTQLASFFERADTLLTGVERVARSSPWERIDRTLMRLESLVDNTARGSETVLAQLDRAGRRLETVLDNTDRLILALDTTFRDARPGISETQREALAALREMHVLLGDLHDALQAGGGVDALVRNMAITTENVARLTTRLERDPSSLLKRRANPRKTAGPDVRE